MATFVLIHGGWGGGWEWRVVAELLRASGHEVYRPTLTGMGERSHLARPDVDLDTHVADIVAVLENEELERVELVGHSYSGAVVTGVVDRASERLSRAIWLDAFVPRDGESVQQLSPEWFAARVRELARDGDGWQTTIPLSPEQIVDGFPPDRAEWYLRRLGRQPLQTLEQPLRLSGGGADVSRAYVSLRPDGVAGWVFDPFEARARDEGWDVRVLPVGHDAQVIAPEALASLLDDIAASEPTRPKPSAAGS